MNTALQIAFAGRYGKPSMMQPNPQWNPTRYEVASRLLFFYDSKRWSICLFFIHNKFWLTKECHKQPLSWHSKK